MRAKLQAKLHREAETERSLSKRNNSPRPIATDHKMKCFAVSRPGGVEEAGSHGTELCESFFLMEIMVLLTH